MKTLLKISIPIAIIVLCFIGYFAYLFLSPNISPKDEKDTYFYIYPGDSFNDVLTALGVKADIKSKSALKQVAKLMKYDYRVRPGRYKIPQHSNNYNFVRNLRNREQSPVRVTFNNIRTKEQLAGRLSAQLMADSASIIELLNNNTFLEKYGFNPQTAIAIFIPDTYEFFWDTNAEKLLERMLREYNNFWTAARKEKATAIPLSQTEVSTLASIVEEETNKSSERPIVAGLYINRLNKGMRLQADPTVKFALGNFGLQRILNTHLEYDSPYNTYKYAGLPPGPIRCPSPNSIDAVLNYQKNNYIYMCAKETLNGEHNFATTLHLHLQNARNYQRALNALKIYK